MTKSISEKHAFLIMAYKSPTQINRIIRALDSSSTDIFLHIDKKSNLSASEIVSPNKSSLIICNRMKVYWADYSQTQCEIELLKRAIECNSYRYYHLISESDYPLVSVSEIVSRFEKSQDLYLHFAAKSNAIETRSFIQYHRLFQKQLSSVNRDNTFSIYKIFDKTLLMLQCVAHVNRIPDDLEIKKGANWFSIPDDFARYVVENEKWIEEHFRNTRSSDEFFMQTLAWNNSCFRARIYRPIEDDSYEGCLRFIDWKRGNPYVFRSSDYGELISSGMIFARKFDESIDKDILDMLEKYVNNLN